MTSQTAARRFYVVGSVLVDATHDFDLTGTRTTKAGAMTAARRLASKMPGFDVVAYTVIDVRTETTVAEFATGRRIGDPVNAARAA